MDDMLFDSFAVLHDLPASVVSSPSRIEAQTVLFTLELVVKPMVVSVF